MSQLPPVVIKIGGAVLEHPATLKQLFSQLTALRQQRQVVLVHGGGRMVDTLLAQAGKSSQWHDGLRVTPDDQMPLVTAALAGAANKQLCSQALQAGHIAVGISLLDGNLVPCSPRQPELGAVGSPQQGDPTLLQQLFDAHFLPIISSIGCDASGRLLNVNADQAATAIAGLLGADLLLLSNVPGVLDAQGQLLGNLTLADLQTLQAQQVVRDGMKVKTDAALSAATTLGRPVTIASWEDPLTEIVAHTCGTRIYPMPTPAGDPL